MSANGRYVLTSPGGTHLDVYDAASGQVTHVSPTSDFPTRGDISNDGRWVTYADQTNAQGSGERLYRVDLATHQRTELDPQHCPGNPDFTMSADGQTIGLITCGEYTSTPHVDKAAYILRFP